MIEINSFIFNSFEVNTFVLHDETRECVIIDAGCYTPQEEKEIMGHIESNNLTPVALLNTHCHVDHIPGNFFLSEKYKLSPRSHILENDLLFGVVDYADIFGLKIKKPPVVKSYLAENETITFGKSNLTTIFVPGHSPGSIAFYNYQQKFLIAGDVLFRGSIGRTDLPGGSYNTLISSIKQKLFVLDDDVIVYPGHGPITTIGEEKKHNPFLQ
ncbi:MAG: MBL fold metallo-hydrolase [Bacteroidales bacterium]|nr:MBL fold metallo-hydrolase [Bacteroidales bacterium]